MIYEREVHFSQMQLDDDVYFPNIIIVKQKKMSNLSTKPNKQSYIGMLKNYIRSQTLKIHDQITLKMREQKQHFQS